MPYKSTNLFAQMVELVDRGQFRKAVVKYGAERGAKGFECWDQLVSMLFCQLGKAQSLREICGGLSSCAGKLNHLGLSEGPKRSTLAYANTHRPWQLFQEAFYQLLSSAQRLDWGQRRFRFRNKLFSMDATFIELCLSLFDWAHFRRTKGAVKLHLVLDHDGYLPTFAHITTGKVHEVRVAKGVIAEQYPFPRGSIAVFDKGYTDLELFDRWCTEGVWFVTRMRDDAAYDIVERREIPSTGNILSDELVEFNGPRSSEKCPHILRRIELWDEEHDQVLVLLTNHLRFGSTTIAAIYKERWQIENFFKAIKQHLRIKTFVGTSSNALHIQIWTALMTILMLKILKLRSTFSWSLSNLVALLRFNLFTYRDLWAWINDPFESPPGQPELVQLSLF